MKRYILAFVAALTLSMGSTQAFRNSNTPQTASEFRMLDPEPMHYKKFLMPDTAVVDGANDGTQTMQPAPARTWGNFAWNGTKTVWNGAKLALSLPSYVLSPLSIATSWTTSKMLTQMFKLPGLRNYLGEKTAAFVGSIIGLTTIYAFNPFGLSTQMLTTLHVLLSVSFGMDVFERLCSLTKAMLNREWNIAGMEFVASVIVGLLIFDAFGIRTSMSNGIAKGANALDTLTGKAISNGTNTAITAAKNNLLNPLLDKLSTSGYERAHTVANSLFSMFGYETDLHTCMRVSGQSPATCAQFVEGYKNGLATCEAHALSQGLTTGSEVCAKLVPQPDYKAMATNAMAMVPTPQEQIGTCYDRCQGPTSRALTAQQPTEWHSEALQKSTDRINQVKDCVATKGLPSSTCAAQVYPSPVQTPGYWTRFMSWFSGSAKQNPTKPSTFVQDVNKCMKDTGLGVNDCGEMASTVNMQGNQCPAYTTNACIKPVVPVATTECEAPIIVSKLYAQTKPVVDNTRALTIGATPANQTTPRVVNDQCPIAATPVDNSLALTVVQTPVANNVPAVKPLPLPKPSTLSPSANSALGHAINQANVATNVVDNSRALTVVTTPANQTTPSITANQRPVVTTTVAPKAKINIVVANDQCPLVEPTECPAYTESACVKPAPAVTQCEAPVIVSKLHAPAPQGNHQPMITNEPVNPWIAQTPSNSATVRFSKTKLHRITPMATVEDQCPVRTNTTRQATRALTCPVPQQSFGEDLLQCKKDTGLAISDCAGQASMFNLENSATCPMIVANACSNPKPFYHPANPWLSISNLAHNTLNGARQYLSSAWNWFTKTAEDANTLLVDTANNLKEQALEIIA